jgi:hypothetical protein
METKPNIIKPFTDETIAVHEAKVGGKRNLRLIELPDDDNNVYVYLVKRPTRSVIQAMTKAGSSNNTEAVAKVLLGCVLEGDVELLESDGSMYLSMIEMITSMVGGVKGEIKKI